MGPFKVPCPPYPHSYLPHTQSQKNTDSLCPSLALAKLLLCLLPALSRLSVLDLVVALAPHADEAAISKLYSTIRPYLEVSSRAGICTQPHLWEKGAPWKGGPCPVFLPCCCPRAGLHLFSRGVAALCTPSGPFCSGLT